MNSYSKSLFTNLCKDPLFKSLIFKVTTREDIDDAGWSYVLACSLILLEQYNSNKEDSFFQLAYYLILKYSLSTNDYKPLYDLSVDAGFFPIANYLLDKIEDDIGLDDSIVSSSIKTDFTENEIVFIEEQKEKLDSFLSDSNRYKSLVAPTSYGKSKLIEKDIRNHSFEKKVAVIVPTKALIWQTFTNLKSLGKELKRRIIIHDSEYDNNESFIGIFTQERALRLIEENHLFFDTIYVDEAHNLFEKDDRSVLLARLLKINEKNNPKQRVVFLSPLVEKSNNFMFGKNMIISENRINNSIKEYDIKYFDSVSLKTDYYNRFTNSFIQVNEQYANIFNYIFTNSTDKNLIYFYTPKNIEKFANEFCNYTNPLNDPQLDGLASLVESYSDKNYLMVEMVKRGAIYIHSKVPDFLKNFLYHCFNTIQSIKYIVSNGCVLEGVDFPIDSLFILDTYSLTINKTINLVGRVNRLKSIFNGQNTKLNKLLCPIHYVYSPTYCSSKIINKIECLRSDVKDDVSNPVLENAVPPKEPEKLTQFNEIKTRENDYIEDKLDDNIMLAVIKNGVDKRYSDFESSLIGIKAKIDSCSQVNNLKELMNAIADIFIKGLDFKNDYMSLARLKNQETVNYYYNYLSSAYHGTLKAKINYIKSSIEYIQKTIHQAIRFL